MEASSERRSVVASGKTVEDAITNGLKMLSVRRDQVDIEVITEGSRGVLGFGAENAQVRLLVKLPPAPAPKPRPMSPAPGSASAPEPLAVPALEPQPPAPTPKPVAPPAAVPVKEPAPVVTAPATTAAVEAEQTAEQVGRQALAELLHMMGIRAAVESQLGYDLAEEDQPPPIVLNITGDDLGILIGRRGETLRALQYMLRLMVSHRLKHWTNLVVDVENYLGRRQHTLESLAERVAEQAVRTGRTQSLEPMPPFERRIVHMALRKHPEVTTQSVGEGERRKVTVIPKRQAR